MTTGSGAGPADPAPLHARPLATVAEVASAMRGRFDDAQLEGIQACIDAASAEIRAEVDAVAPDGLGDDWDIADFALANRICVARSIEWFKQNDALFGVIGYSDIGALRAPRDQFRRWAEALSPLKEQWGVA